MDKKLKPPSRKPGRPKTGVNMEKFTVMLPPWLHEWAMKHPEGFSGLTRRLLINEHNRDTKPGRDNRNPYPP